MNIAKNTNNISKIIKDVNYLVKVSGCSKERAVLALLDEGKIQGQFKAHEIQKILNIKAQVYEHSFNSSEYKFRKFATKEFIENLKEFCDTNLLTQG